MSKILKLQVNVSEATGRVYWIDENGRAHLDPHQPEPSRRFRLAVDRPVP